jgi:hypothetical protein
MAASAAVVTRFAAVAVVTWHTEHEPLDEVSVLVIEKMFVAVRPATCTVNVTVAEAPAPTWTERVAIAPLPLQPGSSRATVFAGIVSVKVVVAATSILPVTVISKLSTSPDRTPSAGTGPPLTSRSTIVVSGEPFGTPGPDDGAGVAAGDVVGVEAVVLGDFGGRGDFGVVPVVGLVAVGPTAIVTGTGGAGDVVAGAAVAGLGAEAQPGPRLLVGEFAPTAGTAKAVPSIIERATTSSPATTRRLPAARSGCRRGRPVTGRIRAC